MISGGTYLARTMRPRGHLVSTGPPGWESHGKATFGRCHLRGSGYATTAIMIDSAARGLMREQLSHAASCPILQAGARDVEHPR